MLGVSHRYVDRLRRVATFPERATMSVDGPRDRPFQRTRDEADRLADALDESTDLTRPPRRAGVLLPCGPLRRGGRAIGVSGPGPPFAEGKTLTNGGRTAIVAPSSGDSST